MRVPALLYGRIPRFFRNVERQGGPGVPESERRGAGRLEGIGSHSAIRNPIPELLVVLRLFWYFNGLKQLFPPPLN